MIDEYTLRYARPGEILAAGLYADGGRWRVWVAVRGGVGDWAIYEGPAEWGAERIAEWGDKVVDEEKIRALVYASPGAMAAYRW